MERIRERSKDVEENQQKRKMQMCTKATINILIYMSLDLE